MSSARAAYLSGERLHLQHGPIDLVIGAEGPDRKAALAAATVRFATVLDELVDELPLLRTELPGIVPNGAIARRMHAACMPHAHLFVTPMAAVAGAVADTVLTAMTDIANLTRAYVNNGGDIALYLAKGARFRVAMAGLDQCSLGHVEIAAGDGIRGIATSGQGGRSHSLGIADSVTVLARSAAEADVAATLIANAVDLPGHPAIRRRPACELAPDSDLGSRLVTVGVDSLTKGEIDTALKAGLDMARAMQRSGLIRAAALVLGTQTRSTGVETPQVMHKERTITHA